jgi:hypothetical protein
MNTQNNQPRKIDFLKLSDSEKVRLIKQTREALLQRVEEAKFWRALTETDGIIVNGQPVAF